MTFINDENMEEERHQNQHGGASQAFIVGIVIGVALTLLFTTKKGRKILHTITSEGMDKIERWEELFYKKTPPAVSEVDAIDDMTVANDYLAAEELKVDNNPSHVSKEAVKHALKTEPTANGEHHPSGVRRFFKGAKKS